MVKEWSREELLGLWVGCQRACVVAAAAELDVFGALADGAARAAEVAERLGTDPRATATLLNALAALGLVTKDEDAYAPAPGVVDLLTDEGAQSVAAMLRHHGNCLRRWVQLPSVVRTGRPAEGEGLDRAHESRAAFIGAMHNVSAPMADRLIADLGPPRFQHLLDVGGASGTWTLAFLRARPEATATLFDLPAVIPFAERRVAEAGMAGRVRLVAGDFYADPLPAGADLAWVSAIIHQNSPEQNLALFGKLHAALEPGGRVLVRDVVLEPSRTEPAMGALFAINMLVATQGGGTYTFDEVAGWLQAAGFAEPTMARRGQAMDSVVAAVKPA